MYYTIISKTPLINKNLSRDERMFRTLVVGSICYVITHAVLFSPKFSNQMIEKYRNYIYYIWGVDLSIAFVMTKFMGNDIIPIDMNINSYAESDTEDNNMNSDNQKFQLETNGDKLTRDEILERFYKQKAHENIQVEKSPFIKSKKDNNNKENKEDNKEIKLSNEIKVENKTINKIEEKMENKQIILTTEEKKSKSIPEPTTELSISDTEIKTYKGKINQNINQNISLSA